MDRKNLYDDDESPTFLERHRVAFSIAAILIIGFGVTTLAKKFSSKGGSSRKGPEMVSVRLPPPAPTPPPPPATPPPPQEMKQEKMVEQAPVDENEEKPKDEPPPSASISTGIKGDGNADGFGVGGGKGNGMIGGPSRPRSKWGWYAAQVQSSIADVLHRNPQIRTASLGLNVRIWADATGRVIRAKISGTSNDPKTDQALQDALMGVQLKEAPPAGMEMPIVMRITAQRPN